MNTIGKFGELIVNYQHPIQISIIALLILLAIVFVIRAGLNAKKKRELLSQINKAVSEINTTVNSLNEKKTEVVYIDNRIPQAPVCPPAVETAPEAAETKPESSAKEEEQTDEVKEEATAEAEVKTQTVKKFFERDCAVSKNGRTYSVEELQNQIRE